MNIKLLMNMKFARLDDSAATVLESKKKMIPIALADEG